MLFVTNSSAKNLFMSRSRTLVMLEDILQDHTLAYIRIMLLRRNWYHYEINELTIFHQHGKKTIKNK